MTSLSEELLFTGSEFFRARVALAAITNRKISINDIRVKDAHNPGISKNEVCILKLYELLSSQTEISISPELLDVKINPGNLFGSQHQIKFVCDYHRGLSYYIEFLMMIGPFLKYGLDIILEGVTDHPNDLSIDEIHRLLTNAETRLNIPITQITVVARGLSPNGGGKVHIKQTPVKKIKHFDFFNVGRIAKISGVVYNCHVTELFSNKAQSSAKKILSNYTNNIFIEFDKCNKERGGESNGFGLTLVAESTSNTVYTSGAVITKDNAREISQLYESMQKKFGISYSYQKSGEQIYSQIHIGDILGEIVAYKLLSEIALGGTFDSKIQWYIIFMMSLTDNEKYNHILFGSLTPFSIMLIKELKDFLGIKYKFFNKEEILNGIYNNLNNNGEVNALLNEQVQEFHSKLNIGTTVLVCKGANIININSISF